MSPSEMSEDMPLTDANRLSTLNSSMEDLKSQNQSVLELLRTFLDKENAAPPAATEKPPIDT